MWKENGRVGICGLDGEAAECYQQSYVDHSVGNLIEVRTIDHAHEVSGGNKDSDGKCISGYSHYIPVNNLATVFLGLENLGEIRFESNGLILLGRGNFRLP